MQTTFSEPWRYRHQLLERFPCPCARRDLQRQDDWIAVLLKRHDAGEAIHRVGPPGKAHSRRFQSWLRLRTPTDPGSRASTP